MPGKFTCIIALTIIFLFAACSHQPKKKEQQAPPLPAKTADLIKILGDTTHVNRKAAIEALKAKGDEVIDPLIQAMSEGEDTREGAIHILTSIGEPAVPKLITALETQDNNIRYGAIIALGKLGPTAINAVEPLMKIFGQSKGLDERIAIMYALVDIAPASNEVLGLMQSSLLVGSLRNYGLRALGKMGSNAANAVPRIITYLEDKDAQTRFEAIECLEKIGPSQDAVKGIAKRLKDEEARVRSRAAIALANFGKSAAPATKALIAALKDSETDVRKNAVKALGNMAPESNEAITALITALSDSEPQIRREAANALAKFGPSASKARSALEKAAYSDNFDYVRDAAKKALEAIKSAK